MIHLAGGAKVDGSFAQTGLLGAIASATYHATNELINWNKLGVDLGFTLAEFVGCSMRR